jgi:hypothetical protein
MKGGRPDNAIGDQFYWARGACGVLHGFLTSAGDHREAQILIKFQREPQSSQGALICENPSPTCEAIFSTLK